MNKNLKLLLLAAIVLSAAFINVAKAQDDDDEDDVEDDPDYEREQELEGEGGRDCEKVQGPGYRAVKVTRTESEVSDSIVFSFRAFPVPRIRVRYFGEEVDSLQVEDDDVESLVDVVTAIPGFFSYLDKDGVAGFNPLTDEIVQRFHLRRNNGAAWEIPVETLSVVDGVQVYKLSVCRKLGDFCFDSYVANDTVTFEGYALKKDSIKLNVIAYPSGDSKLVLPEDERLAVFVKVHYEEGYAVEDNSEENEDLEDEGKPVLTNDVLIGSDQISAYFNWQKFVTVTYDDKTTAELKLISTVINEGDIDFDKKVDAPESTPESPVQPAPGFPGPAKPVPAPVDNSTDLEDFGGSNNSTDIGDDEDDEDDDDYTEDEETEEEQEAEDDDEDYTDEEEDDAVRAVLDNDKIFVFAIDGPLTNAVKLVWDPSAGPTSIKITSEEIPISGSTDTGSGNGAISIALCLQVVLAIIAALAFL